MRLTQGIRGSFVGAVAVLGLCLLGARRADAGHHIHCDGNIDEEYGVCLFGGPIWMGDSLVESTDGCYDCCYSWGYWHVWGDVDTGYFDFHLHGETDDESCFNQHGDIYEWCPGWVHQLLEYECDICIVEEERTHYDIDHHGHVFLKCTGYSVPCDYCEK